MDGDPTDVRVPKLDLTGVKSRPNFDAQRAHRRTDRLRASHGTRGAVEGRDHAITRGIYFAATMTLDLAGDQAVVAIQRPRPHIVAERGGALRRGDNVGEEHG